MAVKKETAQQAAEAATQDTKDVQAEKPATEVIHLFKDNGRYSSARFVSVNGEAYLIQRGVDVEVPAAVAEVLRHSEEMDNAANAKIEAAQAAAQNVPALQKLVTLPPVPSANGGADAGAPRKGATNQRRIHPVRQALAVPGVFAKEESR